MPKGDVDVRDEKGMTRPGDVGTRGAMGARDVDVPGTSRPAVTDDVNVRNRPPAGDRTHEHNFVNGRCECGARKV